MRAEPESRPAPYASVVSIYNYIDHLRAAGSLPTRLDRSVMSHLNYGTQKALVAALKSFGFVDDNDAPTDKLELLVAANESERAPLIREALEKAYPYLFNGRIDLSRATPNELDEQIRAGGGVNGDTLRKSATLFVMLAGDAGLSLSPHLKARKASPPRGPGRSKPAGRRKGRRETSEEREAPSSPTPPAPRPSEDAWLSKFPDFDPSWPDALKEKWFAGFENLMKARQRAEGKK